MASNKLLLSERFPRSSQYHPDWIASSISGAANSLWMTEWLTTALDLRPGMRVLDLGCGRAASSIFLRREFGVYVWATDLWFSVSENIERIRDAGVEDGVFPIHADARSLPFAAEFFDAIVCIDSFYYYGTDDLYLNYLARFVKPGGAVGIAGAGLVREIEGPLPEHLREWWTQDLWCLHSAAWWRQHWERTDIIDRTLRHHGRGLATVVGLAQGDCTGQCIGNQGAGSRSGQLPRIRSPRGSPQWPNKAGRSRCVRAREVHEKTFATTRGVGIASGIWRSTSRTFQERS